MIGGELGISLDVHAQCILLIFGSSHTTEKCGCQSAIFNDGKLLVRFGSVILE